MQSVRLGVKSSNISWARQVTNAIWNEKWQLMLDLGVRKLKRSSIYFSRAEYVMFIFWTFRVKILIFFSPRHVICGILVPWPGIKYGSLAVKAWSLNHWTAREFPRIKILDRWENQYKSSSTRLTVLHNLCVNIPHFGGQYPVFHH